MPDSDSDSPESSSYPWMRSILLLLLYGAAMVFLWNFPEAGGREFFRTLMHGFVYVLAGLVILGITVLLIAALVPSQDKKKDEEKEEKDSQAAAYQGKRRGKAAVSAGRVLTVPALLDPSQADQVWEIVESEAEEQRTGCPVTVDESSGTIAIAETNELEARLLLRGIRERMRQAGLIVHR